LLSGSIVPLAFFPDGLQRLLRLLPFSGLVDTPFRFYLGLTPPHEIFSLGLLQLAWTAVFFLAGSRLLAAGEKRVVIQGG
jgi:ABC-2 type transport system permease protein